VADYTEKATLLLVDKSSSKIKAINNALRSLQKQAQTTAKALNAIGKSGAGTAQSVKQINSLKKAVDGFSRSAAKAKKTTTFKIKVEGATVRQLNALSTALGKYKTNSKGLSTIIGSGGSTGGQFRNLNNLTRGLIRVSRVAQSAAQNLALVAQNARSIPSMGGGRRGGGGGPPAIPRIPPTQPPGFTPRGPQLLGFNLQPLQHVLNSFVVELGHTIVSSMREALVVGAKGFDVARNKEAQQRLSFTDRQAFEEQAFKSYNNNPLIRPDQRLDLYSEVASNFRDPKDALRFDPYIDKAIAVSIQQGKTAEEAIEGVQQLFRGLGQASLLQTNTGAFNTDVFKYIDAFTAATVSEGKQMDWNTIFQFFKQSKTAGQSVSARELFFQLINAADVGGATAGTQFNMNQRTFTGETTKKAINAQEDAGLREPGKMVVSGTDGRGRTTKSYVAGDLKDEELFRENPHDWIQKYILGPDGYLGKKGIDLNTAKASTVISALNPLSGNRNSQDWLAKAVQQYQEDLIKAEKFLDNPMSDKEMKDINSQSLWVQYQQTIQTNTTLMGLLADKLKGAVLPVLDTIQGVENYFTNIIAGKTRPQMQDYAFLAGAGGAGIAGGIAGVKLLQWLSGATGLNTAAAALSTAAAQLSGAAAALNGGRVPGGAGATPAAAAAGGATWMGAILRSIGVAGAAYMLTDTAEGPQGSALQQQLQNARRNSISNQIQDLSRQLSDVNNQISAVTNQQAQNRAAGRPENFGFTTDPALQLGRLNDNRSQILESLSQSSLDLVNAFDTGTTKIVDAANGFGDSASAKLLGIAGEFGTAAGAAIKAAIGQVQVAVSQGSPGAPAPNTGTNTNAATGG
jgi:hypothetical protein